MRTLSGRIGVVLLVFAVATLLAIGGSLWFALRELHREATIGALTELTVPYTTAVRQLVPSGVLRSGPGDVSDEALQRDFIARIRNRDGDLSEFRSALQEEIAEAEVSLIFTVGERSFIVNPEEGAANSLVEVPEVEESLARGQVATGTTTIEGMGDVLYAMTPITAPARLGGQGGQSRSRLEEAPFLMLAREDDSAERATADLLSALTLSGLILVVIGVPLAVGLSRSVTGPLRRLSDATGDVARGRVPEPLPVGGPVEVAEASEAFNAMAHEVGATREAQRQLLADVRHDLRTPLTVIGGFSQALKDGTATGAEAVRAADAISDEAGRLGRMLDDLDHLTVPGVAGPPLRRESLDGLEMARAAVERFAAEAESNGQILRVADDAERTRLVADRDALDRILGNIIANALKHAPSPGGHVSVEVSPHEGKVTLAVCDDGPGIPVTALPHVFDRFYRADPSRTGSGSGLGLAIVRDLAEALEGESFAENIEGTGARVGVVLPATPASMDLPGTG